MMEGGRQKVINSLLATTKRCTQLSTYLDNPPPNTKHARHQPRSSGDQGVDNSVAPVPCHITGIMLLCICVCVWVWHLLACSVHEAWIPTRLCIPHADHTTCRSYITKSIRRSYIPAHPLPPSSCQRATHHALMATGITARVIAQYPIVPHSTKCLQMSDTTTTVHGL